MDYYKLIARDLVKVSPGDYMKVKHASVFVLLALMLVPVVSFGADLRIVPSKINPNGKKSKMKVEILGLEDPKSVVPESITLNGIEPIKVRFTPRKVIARFYRQDVLATLGELQKGQEYELTVNFAIGNSPQPALSDTIKIVGKKKKSPTPAAPTGG